MTKYMVIESFKPNMVDAVYKRFDQKGRMLPDGLAYIDSWLSADRTCCYQLMETENYDLFKVWTAQWDDLTNFEIIELINSPTKLVKHRP